MTLSNVIENMSAGTALRDSCVVLALLLTVLQISPIKINPWGYIAKKVGRAINEEVIAKVDRLEIEVQSQRAEAAEQSAINRRIRIIRFGDEIMHGTLHSKEHFEQVIQDIDGYTRYCVAHPNFLNSITEMTAENIKESYSKRCKKNDFI